jgi:hypothetical protein
VGICSSDGSVGNNEMDDHGVSSLDGRCISHFHIIIVDDGLLITREQDQSHRSMWNNEW